MKPLQLLIIGAIVLAAYLLMKSKPAAAGTPTPATAGTGNALMPWAGTPSAGIPVASGSFDAWLSDAMKKNRTLTT